MRFSRWISGLGLSVGLLTGVGCGGDHNGGAATTGPDVPRPGATRMARPTRTNPGQPHPPATQTETPPPALPTTPGAATVTPTASPVPTHTSLPPPQAALAIGPVRGAPGTTGSLDVMLADVLPGVMIAATQNDLSFDPNGIAVVAKSNGRPDCAVNAAINKQFTVFNFQPPECVPGLDCTGIRAIVLSFTNVDPIPSGSLLYTCRVEIAADAEPELYALACSRAAASDPDGNEIAVACEDGEVQVVQ